MRKIVLVVEDDSDILIDISVLIQFSDFVIINANNHKSALGLLYSHKPDIIVSDMCMPHIDGLELFNKVKSSVDLKDIPFILMTSDRTKKENIQQHKNNLCLVKPFETEELLDNIIDLLKAKLKAKNNLLSIDPY